MTKEWELVLRLFNSAVSIAEVTDL